MVTLYDYMMSTRLASHVLRDIDAVDYSQYMSDPGYDDMRSFDCEIAVSSDGLTFGAVDGRKVLALDLRDGETLFKKFKKRL